MTCYAIMECYAMSRYDTILHAVPLHDLPRSML